MAYETPSVWKEEINNALIAYTKKVVRWERNGSLFVPHVQMRKPLESIKLEAYPCITWYNLMDLNNAWRTDNVVHTSVDKERGKAVEYYEPIPFDLYYQIDFWGMLWGDIDKMSQLWLQALPPYSRGTFFNLPVVDSLGNKTSVLCKQKDILRRRDTLTDGERIFHSTITYDVQAHLGRRYGEDEEVDIITNVAVGRKIEREVK